MCMYVYVYIYIYIYIDMLYIYIYTHVYTHARVHITVAGNGDARGTECDALPARLRLQGHIIINIIIDNDNNNISIITYSCTLITTIVCIDIVCVID